jgi:ribosome modulation factor
MVKMEFTMVDGFTGQPESFCPLGRNDIRWAEPDWKDGLRQALTDKMVSKVHRYNKHLALWHARRLILAWSKGSMSLGTGATSFGFVGREAIGLALAGLGESSVKL